MITITIPASHFFKLLNETSFGELQNKTNAAFGDSRKQEQNTIKVIDLVISPGEKAIQINAKTRNTNSNNTYDTNLVFLDVEYVEKGTPQAVNFTASDGQQYYIKPLQQHRTQVQVSCSCLDFYWTFAAWNSADGSLLGPAPEPYAKKTDRAPRNPTKTPGLCKHLDAVGEAVKRQGLLR